VVEPACEPQAALGAGDAHLSLAPGLVAGAAVGLLALADGGFHPPAWGWATLGLLWAAAAALLVRRRVAISRLELASLAALAALWAWTALSAVWSASAPLTLEEAKRPPVYLAGLAALLVWAARRSVPALVAGVASAGTFVCAWNLAARRWPDALGASIHGFPGDLGAPIGYENAVGIVAAMTVLLAAGVALRPGWRTRAPALGAVAVAGAALGVTESRGAWAALAVGALAALALRLPRAALTLGLVVALGGAAVVGSAVVRSDERRAYWDTTLEAAADEPLLGSGAGTWERRWLALRDEPFAARDAHSLYLESLAELGPLGLTLVLAALAPPLVAAFRARSTQLVPAAGGAYVAFVLHASVDWDWEVPGVTLAGLGCGAALLVAARPRSGPSAQADRGRGLGRTGRFPRRFESRVVLRPSAAPLGALALVAVLAGFGLAGSTALASAADALADGAPGRAESRARLASRLEPWSAEAWRLRGEAQAAQGDEAAARSSFRSAIDEDPGDPELWRALARVSSGAERRAALERAARSDPLGAPPLEAFGRD
jgi:O-antigen ligase